MIYIYLVLGCWLKFVMPEIALYTDGVWYGLIWALTALNLLAATFVYTKKVAASEIQETKSTVHTRIFMVGISALLTFHPVSAVAFALSSYALGMAAKKASKEA